MGNGRPIDGRDARRAAADHAGADLDARWLLGRARLVDLPVLGVFGFRHGGGNRTRHYVHRAHTQPVLLRGGTLGHPGREVSQDRLVALGLLERDPEPTVPKPFQKRRFRPRRCLLRCWESPPCRAFVEAGDEARTRDPQLGKLMLYQLSYAREARILAVPDPPTSADRLVRRLPQSSHRVPRRPESDRRRFMRLLTTACRGVIPVPRRARERAPSPDCILTNAAIPLIVVCQSAVARRGVAP